MRCRRVLLAVAMCLLAAPPALAVVKTSGDLELISDEPLFPATTVWRPGLALVRTIQVKNRSSSAKRLEVEALAEQEVKGLAQALRVELRRNGRAVFGGNLGKTMSAFWDAGGVEVGEITPGDQGETLDILVTLPWETGDEYQGSQASFDLRVGFRDEPHSSVVITSSSSPSTVAETLPPSARPQGSSAATPIPEEPAVTSETPFVSGTGEADNPGSRPPGEVAGAAVAGRRLDWRWLRLLLGLFIGGSVLVIFRFVRQHR